MRSNEERIAEVKRRIAEKEYKKRLRREWSAAICCVAACLAVIVGVSLSMPDTVSRIEMGTASNFETAATILGGSAALGYIVVGLLAFVLGVRDGVMFPHPQTERRRTDRRAKGGKTQMEVVSNLFASRGYPVRLFSGRYPVSEKPETGVFPADLLFMAVSSLDLSTGRCICFCFLKHRRSFMCQSSAG